MAIGPIARVQQCVRGNQQRGQTFQSTKAHERMLKKSDGFDEFSDVAQNVKGGGVDDERGKVADAGGGRGGGRGGGGGGGGRGGGGGGGSCVRGGRCFHQSTRTTIFEWVPEQILQSIGNVAHEVLFLHVNGDVGFGQGFMFGGDQFQWCYHCDANRCTEKNGFEEVAHVVAPCRRKRACV